MATLPRYVLGFDPGMKTGIAVFDLLSEQYYAIEVAWAEYGTQMEKMIDELRPFVAGEKFIINAKTHTNTQAPWSLKALGIAEYLAIKYGCQYEEQVLSTAKRVIGDDRLRVLGWYLKGKGHANDAGRQVGLKLMRSEWTHPAILAGLTPVESSDTVERPVEDDRPEDANVISLLERRK